MNNSVEHHITYGMASQTFSWPGSKYCAVYTWNSWLRLYDLERKGFDQEFTVHDSGGMSAAVSADDRFLYLAAYYSWGLACVEIASRRFVWRRKDLKRFYGLSFSPQDNCLYAEFDRGSAIKMNAETGETIGKLPRVREVSADPYGGYVLMCEPKHLCLCDTSGNTLQKWPREGFKILNVGWSPRTIAIVECEDLLTLQEEFGTRVYDLQSGSLLWRQPRKETQPLGVMFRPESEYVGTEGRLGKTVLVRIGEHTGIIQRQPIPVDGMKCKTCGRGSIGCAVCRHGSLIFAIELYTHETRLFQLGDYAQGIHEA
jgi:hypothetical protein